MPAPPHLPEQASLTSPALGRLTTALLALCSVVLCLCAVVFVVSSRHWPVVGDAALMHYTVLLIQHGWTPYRDFLDVNMPGAFLVTAAAMHLPGSTDAAWRVFDLGLVALAGAGYFAIARVYSRFAALLATGLLLLVHGQDGVQQAGQRDLVMAVLLVVGVACLLEAVRSGRAVFLLPFGLAAGVAATIKPTAAPVAVVLLALCVWHRGGLWRSERASLRNLLGWTGVGLAGLLVPPAIMLLWLLRHGALGAWLRAQRVLLPYYATLGNKPPGFTLMHSLSPLLPLVLLWLACVAVRGPQWNRFERTVIATAALLNLLALLAQGKALPYQRYPMLAFLLILMAIDLTTALRARIVPRTLAVVGLGCASLVLTPLALARVRRFEPQQQEFKWMLEADLHRLHVDHDRQVQCLDGIQECMPTLFAMHLLPATGTLYDIYLFGDGRQAAVQLARQQFSAQLEANPPAALVVVSGFFLEQDSGYQKLAAWPAFARYLDQNYSLSVEQRPSHPVRWWSRPLASAGYRIYLRRAASPPAPLR